MAKISYITRVVTGMHYKDFFKTIHNIHHKTNKNSLLLFTDMVWCMARYGAGYHDYQTFEFYNMKHQNRDTYVTRIRNKKIIMTLNDPEYSDIIDKKNLFDKRFKKYLKREIIDLEESNFDHFKKFMNNKEEIFCKPYNLDSGRGIEKLNKNNFLSLLEMFEYLREKKLRMIEEVIIQHEKMNELYPDAINCMRIVTMVIHGKPEIVYAVQKVGSNHHYLDNMGFDGICAPINLNTGKIRSIGRNEHGKTFIVHPNTKVKFDGFTIPYFQEAIDMVKEASLEIPEIKYVGWDVFISPTGPGIIEGNDYPDYSFWQLPEHTPDKIGLMPYYKEKLKL